MISRGTSGNCHSIADLREAAEKRLPRFVFDYVDGGVEDEAGLIANRTCFDDWRLLPRYLSSSTKPRLATTIFGQTYSHPFGIAPTGLAGLVRPGADLMLARGAARLGVPYIMSGVSNCQIGDAQAVTARGAWYQLYPTRDRAIANAIADRVAQAGVSTLICTIDLPTQSKRERDLRNGFGFPLDVDAALLWSAVARPAWSLRYLTAGGVPFFENWRECAPPDSSALEIASLVRSQSPADYTWADIEALRRVWRGKLVVKGILHPGDATRAIDCGVDGIVISNHGGRQLDGSVTSLEMLPDIREAVGPGVPLLIDSGFRRGSDIVKALCLGADLVLLGRAPLFGAAAFGQDGVSRALEILADECERAMAQIGADSVDQLDAGYLRRRTAR